MRSTTTALVLLAAAALAAALSGAARASNQIAHSEGLACTVCHDKPGSKRLTDRGKYYEAVRTLDGFDRVNAAFGNCTGCHVRKPGSQALTRTGRDFAAVVHDMKGLRELLAREHPPVRRTWVQERQRPGEKPER